MTTNADNGNWSEWIEWNGGDCPLPAGAVHEVRFRIGSADESRHPENWRWNHEDCHGDIIAYRYKLPDTPEVTEEEEEAWQEKERDISIEEARSILSTDNVNHPQHYQSDNGIECIDAIRAALGLDGFVAHCRGTAIKYAFRAGKKQAHAEDLRKAAWYLNRAANALDE